MSRFENLEFEEESRHGFEQESELNKDESFYVQEATRAFEEADFELALRLFSKVLEFNPSNAQSWLGQIRVLIELKKFHKTSIWADKALERLPDQPELLAAKSVALGRMGELSEALAFSDAAMQSSGDSAYLWLARGDVFLARKEKAADYCFDKAVYLAKGNWVISWLASRVKYYYGRFAAALKLAQAALDAHSTQALLWLQVGLCQSQLGLAAASRNSFTQARQLAPHSAGIANTIENLPRVNMMKKVQSFLGKFISHGKR